MIEYQVETDVVRTMQQHLPNRIRVRLIKVETTVQRVPGETTVTTTEKRTIVRGWTLNPNEPAT